MKDKLINFLEQKFMPIAGKIGGNRYLNALKDGFVFTIPFLIVGSFILLLVNLPLQDPSNFMYTAWYDNLMKAYKADLVQPFYVSMGILALFVSYGIGYSLSTTYKLSPVTGGFLALYGFLIVGAKADWIPLSDVAAAKVFLVDAGAWAPVMDMRFLDAKGLFAAIIFSILAVEIYRLMVAKKMTIKLPDSVPPAIAKSFEILIPVAVISVLYQALNIIIQKTTANFIPQLIMKILDPLLRASDSLPSVLLIVLLVHVLWFAGLHGTNIVVAVVNSITLTNLAANQAALQAGLEPTKIFAGGFLDSYVYMGGVGATLGLAIAMVRSKNKHLNSIGKLSIFPAVFNINEPIMFGVPIVMNPILAIPFVFIPVINTIIAYVLTQLGLIGHVVSLVPWTTPGPLAALLATNFNIFSMLLSIVLIFTSYLMYYPFFKAYEASLEKEEAKKI